MCGIVSYLFQMRVCNIGQSKLHWWNKKQPEPVSVWIGLKSARQYPNDLQVPLNNRQEDPSVVHCL